MTLKSKDGKLSPLSRRERLVVYLILLLVRILQPWEYEHEFKATLEEVSTLLERED